MAALKPWKEIVDREGLRVVGNTKVQLSHSNCSVAECNIGSFITDAYASAMIDEAEAGDWTYSPIALVGIGGIRTTLGKGNLTYGDLVSCVPFEDTLDTMDILGEHLVLVLEHAAAKSLSDDQFRGANMLQISGMKIC